MTLSDFFNFLVEQAFSEIDGFLFAATRLTAIMLAVGTSANFPENEIIFWLF